MTKAFAMGKLAKYAFLKDSVKAAFLMI